MRIKRLRLKEMLEEKAQAEKRTISANEVAKAVGVSHNTILSYLKDEGREPSHSLVIKLSKYLGCTTDELVVWDEPEEESIFAA